MTPEQIQLWGAMSLAILRLEMLQQMALHSQDVLNAYSIQDYVMVLEHTVNEVSSLFSQLDENITIKR